MKLNGLILGLGLAGAVVLSGAAQATAQLTITDSLGNTATVSDVGNTGTVTFSGVIGFWSVNVVTGLTHPIVGSTAHPAMDVNFVDVYNGTGAGNVLTIMWSDIGFTGTGTFNSDIGGTNAGTSVSYHDYASATNALNALTTSLGAGGPFAGASFSQSASGTYNGTTPYSLTQVVTLTATGGAGSHVSGDHSLLIPEPGTLLLVGAGLLCLGAIGRRRSV